MEILKFLIDFFTKNENTSNYAPIFKLLEENSYDVKKIINNLSIDKVMPLIECFMSTKKDSPIKEEPCSNKLSPIKSVCDTEIINALSCYFGE